MADTIELTLPPPRVFSRAEVEFLRSHALDQAMHEERWATNAMEELAKIERTFSSLEAEMGHARALRIQQDQVDDFHRYRSGIKGWLCIAQVAEMALQSPLPWPTTPFVSPSPAPPEAL